jgi:hypothetical protein
MKTMAPKSFGEAFTIFFVLKRPQKYFLIVENTSKKISKNVFSKKVKSYYLYHISCTDHGGHKDIYTTINSQSKTEGSEKAIF